MQRQAAAERTEDTRNKRRQKDEGTEGVSSGVRHPGKPEGRLFSREQEKAWPR